MALPVPGVPSHQREAEDFAIDTSVTGTGGTRSGVPCPDILSLLAGFRHWRRPLEVWG